VVSFTLRPLYLQGKSPCYPLDRSLGRYQSRSGRGGEEKNSQLLPGLELPIIQPVAQCYTTEPCRLSICIKDSIHTHTHARTYSRDIAERYVSEMKICLFGVMLAFVIVQDQPEAILYVMYALTARPVCLAKCSVHNYKCNFKTILVSRFARPYVVHSDNV
jgi:hypothetical protein